MMAGKYFKPRSVTWWTGAANLSAGIFLASEPVHGFEQWAEAVRLAFGGASASVLITAGLGLIGLRGAVGVDR